MEPSNSWYFVLFLIPFMYVCINKFSIGKKKDIRLPPGTSGLPFIGETLSFFLKFGKGLVGEFISDRMKRYSSTVFRTSLMGENMVVMSGAEGNKFVFTNEGTLVESWFPRRLEKLFNVSGDRTLHEQGKISRNVLRPRLSKVSGLQDCVGVMDAVMKQHLGAYWTSKDGDQFLVKASEMAQRFAVGVVSSALFRMNDLGEIEQYVEWLKAIERAYIAAPINFPGTAWNRGINACKALCLRLEVLIKEEKENEFFADMILAKDGNGESMSLPDVAANCIGLLLGGYSTSHTTITMLMKALADHPHVYDSVLQEQEEIASSKTPGDGLLWDDFAKMKYSWNVVREVLRLYLTGGGGFKEALTDITYQGYTIPKGWKIFWHAQPTHMDPAIFPNPEKFDPSRWDSEVPIPAYTFIPFAAGTGMCPGHIFVKLEALTFLHHVVTKFRWECVNPNENMLFNLVPYPAQGLPIRLYRHKG